MWLKKHLNKWLTDFQIKCLIHDKHKLKSRLQLDNSAKISPLFLHSIFFFFVHISKNLIRIN